MKIVLVFGLSAILSLSLMVNASTPTTEKNTADSSRKQDSVLRHVVLFKFKEETSEVKVTEIEEAFTALPGKIPQIVGYEWGLNNSPEGLEKGFTHCFFLTFKNEEDREVYLPHPDHQAFVALLKPHLDDVLVIDYWTR